MSNRLPGSRAEDAWLSDAQLAQCTPADEAEGSDRRYPRRWCRTASTCRSPQTDEQKRVEARVQELADAASRQPGHQPPPFPGRHGRHGGLLPRHEQGVRAVLQGRPAGDARAGGVRTRRRPARLFVFDDQLHMVRGSRGKAVGALRGLAEGPTIGPSLGLKPTRSTRAGHLDEHGASWGVWNPALVGLPFNPANFLLTDFIRQVYLDSQVTVGMLTNVTGRA